MFKSIIKWLFGNQNKDNVMHKQCSSTHDCINTGAVFNIRTGIGTYRIVEQVSIFLQDDFEWVFLNLKHIGPRKTVGNYIFVTNVELYSGEFNTLQNEFLKIEGYRSVIRDIDKFIINQSSM